MLAHKKLVNDKDWYFTCGTYGYDWYSVGDVYNWNTTERGVGVRVDFVIVGKDELDALYRIQRIIEDKIHEARMRPVVDEVVSDDSDTCSGVDTYPDDNHPFG
jgi:hypothetical protein